MQKRILIVDDDQRLRDLLLRYLSEQGFQASAVGDGVAMQQYLSSQETDLLVLDLMLPGEDGLALCRKLRGSGNHVPIIMLTARGDEVDRIVGLEMGADDYLPKPFNPRELLARINAVLRRRVPVQAPTENVPSQFRFGPFLFDPATRSLHRDGVPLSLTSGEFALLNVLVSHPRQPLSRDKLMEMARVAN